MAYVKEFFTDTDVEVSSAGIFTNAVIETVLLGEESDPVSLYAKADTGYSIADCVCTPTGTGAAKWALAPDDDGGPGTFGSWGAALNLGTVTEEGTVPFWVKCKAAGDESLGNDDTVTLDLSGTASAVTP